MKTLSKQCWRFMIVIFACCPSAVAQSGMGRITGTVQDPAGAVIPGASVIARNEETSVEIKTLTTETGNYTFPRLAVGVYRLTTASPGFQTMERTNVRVVLGESLTADFQLSIGAVTETTKVVAEFPRIDTTSTTVGGTRVSEEITDLPLQVTSSAGGGRDPLNFIRTMPGVVYAGPLSTVQGVGDQGGFRSITGAKVDGVIAAVQQNSALNGSHAPIPELVEEFRLVTNQNAESGWDMGTTVELVTKSGTNQFHGAAFEFLRNDALDARNWFASTVSRQKQNEFGGLLGGPILRNKLFFMTSYEGYRFRTSPADRLASVPTAKMRAGDFSELLGAQVGTDTLGRPVYRGQIFDPRTTRTDGRGGFIRDPFPGNLIQDARLSPISRNFQQGYPLPNLPGTQNNWRGLGIPIYLDSDRTYLKLDADFGPHRVSGTWESKWRIRDVAGTCIFAPEISSCQRDNLPQRRIRINYNWALSPNLLYSIRAGLNQDMGGVERFVENTNNGAKAGLRGVPTPDTPGVGIQNISAFGGVGLNRRTNTAIPISTDLSWATGKHNLKFGAEVLASNTVQVVEAQTSGLFSFNQRETAMPALNTVTGDGYASYLLGEVDSATIQTPRALRYNNYAWGFYAQDQWRANAKLTINYGLRYDLFLPFGETYDRLGAFDPTVRNPAAGGLPGGLTFWGDGPGRNGRHRLLDTYYRGFGPRLGLAYRLTSSTVVRAYYGIQHYPLNNLANNGLQFPGINLGWGVALSTASLNNGVTPAFNWDNGFPVQVPPLPNLNPSLINRSSVSYLNPRENKSGIGQNLGFSVERGNLPGRISVRADYVGKLIHNLPNNTLVGLNQLDPKYLPLGNLLLSDINSSQARDAGIQIPYPGFAGSVAQALRPFPQYDNIPASLSMSGSTLYHAFELSLRKQFTRGFTFLVAYTFSKNLTTDKQAAPASLAAPSAVQHNNLRATAKALANFDRPQVLNISSIYQLPFGPGKRFLNTAHPIVRGVVGGWQVSGVLTYQSGTPVTVVTQGSIPGVGSPVWANRVLETPITTGIGCGSYNPNDPARNRYLNSNAFVAPRAYTFGNTFVLPSTRTCGTANEDVSLAKLFPIKEDVHLQVGADFFNLLNRHFWTGLNTNIDQPATYGKYVAASTPRTIQVYLKIRF